MVFFMQHSLWKKHFPITSICRNTDDSIYKNMKNYWNKACKNHSVWKLLQQRQQEDAAPYKCHSKYRPAFWAWFVVTVRMSCLPVDSACVKQSKNGILNLKYYWFGKNNSWKNFLKKKKFPCWGIEPQLLDPMCTALTTVLQGKTFLWLLAILYWHKRSGWHWTPYFCSIYSTGPTKLTWKRKWAQ